MKMENLKQQRFEETHAVHSHYEKLIKYYEDAGADYHAWSKLYNMHFGICNLGDNPFNREKMLEEMNAEVIERLQLEGEGEFLLDLGCGLGATAVHAAKKLPGSNITGITIVPWQIENGNKIIEEKGCSNSAQIIYGDYTAIPFPSACADGAYAIESMCHCSGEDKEAFISELHRVLKPGKRFVLADGFLKKKPSELRHFLKGCYKGICDNWVLQGMAQLQPFVKRLEQQGFYDIEIEDMSWKVAPSVAHVPFVIITFLIQNMLKGKTLKKQSINNLKGAFLSMILGLHTSSFGYFLVSGRKG